MKATLKEELRECINTDTLESLCKSINEIGPYVSGLAMNNPLSVFKLKWYNGAWTRRNAYRQFHIPKKSGGTRTITAPSGKLKDILSTLAYILSELYVPTPEAMAFVPQRSIVDNARQHLGHNYVLNIDLSDFFTSITAGWWSVV